VTVPPILCAVTDRRRLPILAHVAAAADAGLDWVQIREPDLPAAELYEVVRHAIAEVSGAATRIIVNDRLDVAIAAGAHGVHLRGTSFDASRVRAVAPADFVIGRSVHSVEEAVAAESGGGLDYLIFGTMFPTASKPQGHPLAGTEALRAAVAACGGRVSILAIGGITRENVDRIAATGAVGVAAIGLFLDSQPDGIASIRRSFAAARSR
jgi:thiamine-phosphate diphosphorylase